MKTIFRKTPRLIMKINLTKSLAGLITLTFLLIPATAFASSIDYTTSQDGIQSEQIQNIISGTSTIEAELARQHTSVTEQLQHMSDEYISMLSDPTLSAEQKNDIEEMISCLQDEIQEYSSFSKERLQLQSNQSPSKIITKVGTPQE